MDLISSIGMDGYQHIVRVDLQEVVVIYFNTSRNHSPRRGWWSSEACSLFCIHTPNKRNALCN